jgi:hypothetical protein
MSHSIPLYGIGLLSNILDISSMSAAVIVFATSIAPRFSTSCSGFVAPNNTVLTFLFLMHQAIASWPTLQL